MDSWAPSKKGWIERGARFIHELVKRGTDGFDSPCRKTLPGRQLCMRVLAIALGAGTLLGGGVGTGCDYNRYPIEASFCDDWCRTLRRTACDQEPENCVRDCESALPSERCFEHQVILLECYRRTPSDQLVCVDEGFQDEVRPRPEICTMERDALVACEAPRVMSCIEACRALDAADPVIAGDAPGAGLCPVSPLPCERLCWEIDARAATLGVGAADAGEGDLSALGAPLVTCAHEGARECLAGASGGDGDERVSWTSLFLECAGLDADFDLFD